MTTDFDYGALWAKAHFQDDPATYLREQIEAAFVPLATHEAMKRAALNLEFAVGEEVKILRQKETTEYRAAITLDSEREANSILTDELDAMTARAEAAEAEVARLREALGEAKTAIHHRGGPLCSTRYYSDVECHCGATDAIARINEALGDAQ